MGVAKPTDRHWFPKTPPPALYFNLLPTRQKLLGSEMRLDDMNDSVQDFDWPHHGKRYVDAFESWVQMASWRVEGIIPFLLRIEIYSKESKTTGGEKGEIKAVRQNGSLFTVKP
jgi:hypothetical protein